MDKMRIVYRSKGDTIRWFVIVDRSEVKAKKAELEAKGKQICFVERVK